MSQQGKLYINDKCAWTQWGVYLGDGSLSALMAPPSIKDVITNTNRQNHGIEVLTSNAKNQSLLRYGAQDITLYLYLSASSYSELYQRQQSLFDELIKGVTGIKVAELPGKVFRLVYQQASQYSQFNGEIAKFSVKFIEPDPTNRNI